MVKKVTGRQRNEVSPRELRWLQTKNHLKDGQSTCIRPGRLFKVVCENVLGF